MRNSMSGLRKNINNNIFSSHETLHNGNYKYMWEIKKNWYFYGDILTKFKSDPNNVKIRIKRPVELYGHGKVGTPS